jgi:hypothetical protein
VSANPQSTSRYLRIDSGARSAAACLPVRAVSYLEPGHDWDSGYARFSGPPDSDAKTAPVCLHCLIEEVPEIGRGMDVARRHGEAIRKRGVWTPHVMAASGNSPVISCDAGACGHGQTSGH